jgi:hypothetical protein
MGQAKNELQASVTAASEGRCLATRRHGGHRAPFHYWLLSHPGGYGDLSGWHNDTVNVNGVTG